MSYLQGDDRSQAWMLPQSLEDYLSEDNPVRFIDAFVDELDFRQAKLPVEAAATGRPGYAPGDLLKLYLYGYLNRVRSSRELERLTHRNLEVIWLLKRLQPDHKTISEFRKAHSEAFKSVLRQFNLMCRELKLFGAELVAIDGSIFKAVNSKARNFTRTKLESLLRGVNTGIERYLKELELNDAAQQADAAAVGAAKAARIKDLPGRVEKLKETRERYTEMMKTLEETPGVQISLTDPEARLMKKSTSKDSQVGYNIQSAVDAAHHLIVEVEATAQANDAGQFNTMAQRAKEQLGVERLTVVADGGYYVLKDIKAAGEQGIEAHVPAQRDTMEKAGLHARRQFRYDEAHDEYECPGKARLTRHADSHQRGQVQQAYYNTAACAACTLRSQCTTGKYRKINHGEGYPQVQESIRERMERQPEIYAQRKKLVEHPFGTIKFWWGQAAFLTRGLEAVNAEVSLSALGYNMRRVLNIVGTGELIKHLGKRAATAA
ncbi:transposase [Prosthecobacter fusiformis]|uniref:Transposase n=4 Tax=Prosthecobacter fusiformis TaxID=48464 RepID=A0A4R7RHZ4_9BACT|nr:IS1182 family transposase [Prosthecobacter fusiformis]TDU62067.1 transposase [Prosthecobacter fusiformis]